MKKWGLFIGVVIIGLTSCERVFMEPEPAQSPSANFNDLWHELDSRYAFFTYKNIDWDSIKTALEPRLEPDMSQEALFDLLADMLYALEDGHVNLTAPFDVSRNWNGYLNYPENFNYALIERHYLGEDHRRTGPLLNSFLADSKVGYIYYGSFANSVSETNIDFVIDRFKNCEAIIFDVRNNGGGRLENVDKIVSRFADQARHVYDVRYKTGPDHDAFSAPYPHVIGPEGEQQFTKPVYVLTNRRCYSSTTFFIQSMREFPHVTITGDQSGGGGGSPISRELPNGWVYRFSSNQTLSPDGFNIENGIPADFPLSLDPDSANAGKDSMIEGVLEAIEGG